MRQVIIVGSGPAGFTAAIYAARADLKPLVIASSVEVGGELMNTTDVENFPGFNEGVQGPELMEKMQAQAERFGAEIVYDDVAALELDGPVKRVTLAGGAVHEAASIIYATGSAYRKLGLEGEERLTGHGVSWCATCDGFFFRQQEIAVIGGGDSAMEEATFLTRFAEKVYIVHRRDEFRASKIMADRALANPKIEVIWDTEVLDMIGDQKLTGLSLRNRKTGEESTLAVTGAFIAIGHDPRSELVAGQVDLDDEGYVVVQGRSSRTNLDGVFACGDLVDHTYRQAITAAGSGCAAALDAERWLADLHG